MADKPFNLAKWAKDAIQVQDACNLSGVIHSFSRMLTEMNDAGFDTYAKNRHPCSVLFSSKVASLTSSESPSEFSKAYTQAKVMAGE